MHNVTTFGLKGYITAARTFPVGMLLNAFTDETDAFRFDPVQTGDSRIDLNGSIVSWTKAVPIPLSISVIPHSLEDQTLSILWNANRSAGAQVSANDEITLIVYYPDVEVRTFTKGRIVEGPSGATTPSNGRMQGLTYRFLFEDVAVASWGTALNAGVKAIGSLLGF